MNIRMLTCEFMWYDDCDYCRNNYIICSHRFLRMGVATIATVELERTQTESIPCL